MAVTNKDIANGVATFNGTIVSLGDLGYTEKGFAYGIAHNPTIDNNKVTSSGEGTGDFFATASELEEGKTYYIRAYVTNSKGTVYGEEVAMDYTAGMPEVKTLEVTNKNIGAGTATFKGSISSLGDLGYTERGFVYATVHNPTIGDTKAIAEGSGTGEFSATATQLEEGKVYYIRAYATNSKSTVYGEEIEMDYTAAMPVVKTVSIVSKNIAEGVATFKGNVVSLGDLACTERGFVYSTTNTPTIDNNKVTASGTGTGTFTASASQLQEGKTYYIRAFVTNKKGTVYGEELTMDYTAAMPDVKTLEVTNKNIGAGTATFKGSILSLGDLGYTERGFVYATVHNPTIGDSKAIAEGSGTGEFSATASALVEGNTYYIRAYATNSKSTVYGEEIEMDYTAAMPVVKTVSIVSKNIAEGVATFKGNVVSLGDLACTERGFVYSTTNTPTVDNNKITASGTGTGTFTATASQLQEGKTYYIRAFVTNKKGTVYGEELTMDYTAGMPEVKTLEVTNKNIGAGTATFKGSILSLGDLGYTERGFVYATVHNPTIGDTKAIAEGSGTGEFYATASALVEGNTYYIRAYATNSKSTVYGEEIEMDYTAVMPVVKTVSVVSKNIATGSATFKGNIVSVGDLAYTERGFVYGIAHNPTIDDNKITSSGNGTGDFTASASELAEGKTYYIRAYVTNKKGTVYGEELTMDYTASMPEVKTLAVGNKNIGAGTATFKGSIVSLGDLGYTERGFAYATVHNPTIGDSKLTASGNGTGEFSANAIQLVEGNQYYIRAYATNSKGTVYGEEVSVDFNGVMPVVSTQAVSGKIIAQGVATLNGTIESKGDPAYTQRGFVYGVAHNPTKDDATVVNVSGTNIGAYTYNLNNLEMGSVYYVRAFATSSKGTAYGSEVTLDFNAVMPEVETISVEFESVTSSYVIGKITHVGDPEYIERGFIYGTMQTPMIDDDAVTKVVVAKNTSDQFEKQITNANWGNQLWYIRAYAISSAGVSYGEIKIVHNPEYAKYLKLPTFDFGGYLYRVYPDMGEMKWSQAINACEGLSYGDYDDWYLPSKEELNAMYQERLSIGGFFNAWYWSSTRRNTYYAYYQDFTDGSIFFEEYADTYRVRCIRKEN